ncbi:MAG: autotransporter-associated beta strand repeat-containing protein [Akkermansia sp.]|nr:autotransporter-associated beta strand repeat-containing protein [Akkermansia sp.]
MKLHLPLSLLKSLLLLTSFVGVTVGTANAICMHTDATFQTYADFGQNMGRYVVGNKVNALVRQIRENDGGIAIQYTTGADPYIIPNSQGMINLTATIDEGDGAMISPTFLASVEHVWSLNASFSQRLLGDEHRVSYSAIDIYGSNVFRLNPLNVYGGNYDYVVQRQSKVVTDATWNELTTVTDINTLVGQHLYHSGAGAKALYDASTGVTTEYGWAYQFITGAINQIQSVQIHEGTTNISVFHYLDLKGASDVNPLPFRGRSGDSGSPIFIYNSENNRYEYLAGHQSSGGTMSQARGNLEYTREKLVQFDVNVEMPESGALYLNAVNIEDETRTDNGGRSGTEWHGTITNEQGEETARFAGVKTGVNTWASLHELKDTQNWYAYTSDSYLQVSDQDLFFTDNLLFNTTGTENEIILKDTVDLGIGYAGFSGGSYTIKSEGNEGNLFNHAGYVINAGAEVHLQLNNKADYMYEWRKTGAGDLYIDGQGDTNALLVLGGTGSTYLQQQGGHAAYNVLVGSGARVEIADKAQIERDFTFGNGGGTLDMNGNSMDWYTSGDTEGRFTINALTEEAIITNSSDHVTLTYKQGGENTWLGSFKDSATGSLHIDYQGGGVLTLHSIHTDLSQSEGSGMTVTNGRVVLVGTNTLHGKGSVNGQTGERLLKTDDWHYADSAMNVTVKNGATFELGSHARLTGDVTVNEGATFIMREGVQHRMEYVEGGAFREDTNKYADYFGLKGNVNLAGYMRVEFNTGVDSRLSYNGNIAGTGALSVNLGTEGAILELGGDNSRMSGTKQIEAGGVVLLTADATGDTSDNKWIVSTDGWIANQAENAEQLLACIDERSTGTLALSANTSEQLDLCQHQWLTLGAEFGKTVQYGEAGTQEALNAQQGAWLLGGGGGELVVNYKLSGANDLILGASGHSYGTVTLTNTQNDFSGDIIFRGAGIVLNTVDGSMGNSVLNLTYGNAFGLPSAESITKNVGRSADGMVTVDAVASENLDMRHHASLAIAAEKEVEFSGSIALAEGQGYLFSSATGAQLTVASELDGTRSLTVDAQGITGGTVILAGNDIWSGDITVQGHKDNNGKGEISLLLGRDMTATGTLTVARNCTLDLNGHSLTVTHNLVHHGGVLTNSAETGALIFDTSAGELSASANLSISEIRKVGSAMLAFGGNNTIDNFYVEEGTLRLNSDDAFSRSSTIHLGDGTTLDNRTHALLGNVQAEGGTANLTSSNHNHIVIRGDLSVGDNSQLIMGRSGISSITIDGDLTIGSNADLSMRCDSWTSLTFGNDINLAEGTDLSFGNATNVTLKGENIGAGGSTINVNGGTLGLNRGGNISINGNLAINGNTTIRSAGSTDTMERNFESLHLNGGNLTIQEESWNTIWNINELKGSGNIQWESTTNHYNSSRLILNGEGNFTGNITFNRTYLNNTRPYGAFLELASENVAVNADISLNGAAANSIASLAINTDNARIKGLSGNEHSLVYAGSSMVQTELSESGATVANHPATTRATTLFINTDADSAYTFSGTFGNTTDTAENGFSLVKTGAGTQTINGASAVLNNVTALAGTLNIEPTVLTVYGNVELACGAILKLGESFSLNAGQNLSLLSGAEGSGSAVLNSALVLNGGTITIDAGALSTNAPMLDLGGTVSVGSNFGNSCQIDFTRTSMISLGTDYLIADGNWRDLSNRISIASEDYLTPTLTASSTGLSIRFSLKDEYILWEGDEQALQVGNKVLFSDINGDTTANLTADAEINSAIFANDSTFTVSGGSLSANYIQKQGNGELLLYSDVSADNMQVKEATTIGGTATLSVGTLTLEDNFTTRTAVQVGELHADDATWTVDGSNGNAFTQQLTLDQVNATAGMNVEGAATLEVQVEGGNQENPLTFSGVVSGSGHIALVGGGSLEKNQQEHINLAHAKLSNLVLKNGSTDITGVVNISERLAIGQETVRFLDGAQVTVSQFRMGDTANGQSSTVTIEEGAALNVTGHEDGDNTSASFLLAHWKQAFSTLVLNGGTITAENACLHMGWDSGARFDALTGEATLKGIRFSGERYHADTLILGNARLNIGSGGISGIGSNDTVQLGNGTIAATANFSINGNKAIELVDTTKGTTFDTAAHTITVNTAFTGNGNLVKTGDGTLNLAAATTLSGDVTLQAGTLQISNNSGTTELAHLTGDGVLTKTGSGSLKLDSATIGTVLLQGSGQTDFTGDVSISEQLSIGNHTVNIQDGAVVTTARLTASDRGSYVSSTININGGALNITGTVNNANTQNSFFLTHWKNSTSVLNLNSGSLNAVGAVMYTSWDSRGSFNAMGGEAELLGINLLGHDYPDRNGAFTLGTQDEGSAIVKIGTMGITGLTGGASVTLGNGTIASTADFSINGDKAIEMVGTTNGTTFDTASHTITVNTALTGNGNLVKTGDGTLNLNAATTQYTGNVNINGGTLVLSSNALGVLTSGSKLVVNQGGTLDLSAATVSSDLFNPISGTGTVILTYTMNNDNGTGFDFSNFSGNVKLNQGRVLLSSSTFGAEAPDFTLTSANSQLVFDSNNTVVNGNIYLQAGTTIHANNHKDGEITGELSGNHALTKQGAGKLTLSGKVDIGTLNTKSGEIVLAHSGETGNTIGMLDTSIGNSASGKLRLAQNSHTTVAGNIWARANNTSILLENGASLTNVQDSVTFTNKGAAEEATLRYIGTTNDDEYSIADAWELTGGHLTYTGGDATINNKLTNSSIENAGSGTLTVDNAGNTLSAVYATGGSVKLLSDAELDLQELEIATSLSVSAYSQLSEQAAQEARINVRGTANFGMGVTLNADLVMKSGATLKVADTVQMGSDVRLENGLKLAGAQYDTLNSLKVGEKVTLFSGVDSLFLGNSTVASDAITLDDRVLANEYFSNLADSYFLVYDTTAGVGQGELSIAMIPEPTTATLSLVALAALAMRRRRK